MEGSRKHSKKAAPETKCTDLCDVYAPATERTGKKPGSERGETENVLDCIFKVSCNASQSWPLARSTDDLQGPPQQ